MTNSSPQQNIIQEFSKHSSWEDRYKKLIQLGQSLPPMPDELKTDDLKIRGCQSQVWLFAELRDNGKIHFLADSDALIVKGLVAILLAIYNNQTPEEILQCEPTFISALGFDTHLSPSRTNGLHSMIKQIKYYALAYSMKRSI